MRKFLLSAILLVSVPILGQTSDNLKSQIGYCKTENERLENELKKLKGLLDLQTADVQGLKQKIQDKDQIIVELQIEKYELQEAAVNFINLALKFEKEGGYESAMEVYKVLIKSFPSSLEAASSRIQVEDLRKDLKQE